MKNNIPPPKKVNHLSKKYKKRIKMITAKSGLRVNVYDDDWKILPTKGKGHLINMEWVHSSNMRDEHKELILDVLAHYTKFRAASTAAGIVYNTKKFFIKSGIPSLIKLESYWSDLLTSQKKGHNQFFCMIVKLGNNQFKDYHLFTREHLDKEKSKSSDFSKGPLTAIEFDSLAQQVNFKIDAINWSDEHTFDFYSSQKFGQIRNVIATKLMISILRRPIQISLSKWSDLIPVGESFNDNNIDSVNEVGVVGEKALQIRVFKAKEKQNILQNRDNPEAYPLPLHEIFSKELTSYKKLFFEGVKLLFITNGIEADDKSTLLAMNDMPVFPDYDLFNIKFNSVQVLNKIFIQQSNSYHISEGSISDAIRRYKLLSDRSPYCYASSNNLRHTVLTRAAQNGLDTAHLAKITGVTEPAVRHYIDLDYKSRRMIDDIYMGNTFLKQAFNTPIKYISENGELILDQNFNAIGEAHIKATCNKCLAKLGKPLGCYGCLNFHPFLEADHYSVLNAAIKKRDCNNQALLSPVSYTHLTLPTIYSV